MLTLRYVPELDDIVELMAMSPERRRLRRRAVRNAAVSLVPLCAVLWVGVAERTPGALPVLPICAAISGSYLQRARALFSRRRLRRRARGVWDRSPSLQRTYEEEIAPEALTLRTDEITQTFAWSVFSGFVESDRQFVLMDRSGEPSVALPKRGLPDPSLVPACRRLLTEHLTAARACRPRRRLTAPAADGLHRDEFRPGAGSVLVAGFHGRDRGRDSMTVQTVVDEAEFTRLTDPYRRELLAFCYSMLGSVEDAEDLVQETYLRAWRSYGGFEGRSSLRSWLYRIATNRCLTALERRGRRPLPSGLAGPADPDAPLVGAGPEIAWLQPFPDPPSTASADPAVIVAGRDSVRLALVAAMQHLSARQRAVLILRDVLAWRAAEVGEVLGMTTIAVNSALHHARARLGRAAAVEDGLTEPPEAERRALLTRFVRAFEDADVAGLVALLHEDVVMEMPPYLTWFAGRAAVIGFMERRCLHAPGDFRLVSVSANGQPAVGAYLREPDGVHRAHAIQVLTVRTTGITRIDTFLEPGLFAAFGLPATYPESCRVG